MLSLLKEDSDAYERSNVYDVSEQAFKQVQSTDSDPVYIEIQKNNITRSKEYAVHPSAVLIKARISLNLENKKYLQNKYSSNSGILNAKV